VKAERKKKLHFRDLLRIVELSAMSDIPKQVRVVGISWFRQQDYPALLRMFDDAHELPRVWKEWLQGAEQMEERTKAAGHAVERVYIDPDTFPDWCRREGVGVNREGRDKFVATIVASKYGNPPEIL
jgi:hypothetical protein